jgi:hypothetical protein
MSVNSNRTIKVLNHPEHRRLASYPKPAFFPSDCAVPAYALPISLFAIVMPNTYLAGRNIPLHKLFNYNI